MNRRDFVIKSSLSSVALVASASVLGSVSHLINSPNSTVNIGVIGTGSRGSGLIPFINNIDGLNLVACCDVLPFRLEKGLSNSNGNPKGYLDYRKLLDSKDVDAVLVATPFYNHSQIGIDALDAGKHVYGEKTLAKGYGNIKRLLDKSETSNTVFQTGHQLHSSQLYLHVVNLIKNGKIGRIEAFECQYNRDTSWRRPVPSPDLEKIINWRMYREFSGGLLAELSSHQIDFVNWVLEATPEKVIGVGGLDYWNDGREIFDNIHLIYSYPEGVKAKFTCLGTNAKDGYQIKVLGNKGTIILDFTKAWFYPKENKKKYGNVDGVSGATIKWEQGKGIPIEVSDNKNPSSQALIDFRDSIRNHKKPISNIVTGAKTAVAVQMGLDAMYGNQAVEWNREVGV